jgi:hypothetical protein
VLGTLLKEIGVRVDDVNDCLLVFYWYHLPYSATKHTGPCQLSFNQMLLTHLSFEPGTVGQLVADVRSGLSLTLPHETEIKFHKDWFSHSEVDWGGGGTQTAW